MNVTASIVNRRNPSRFMLVVLVSVLYVIVSSASVFAAQTQAQAEKCKAEYDGKQLTQTQYQNRYKKSDCRASQGGNCIAESVGNGSAVYFNIKCSNKAGQPPGGEDDEPGTITPPSTTPIKKIEGCNGIKTSIIKCDSTGGNPVTSILLQVINFLAIGVGIAVVGGIIWGGMLYASSNGDASKTKQGITVIVNAVIGLLLFIFMYAIINFLVPGGVFT
jgi:hypothetical protein